jgi:hypothetical protein
MKRAPRRVEISNLTIRWLAEHGGTSANAQTRSTKGLIMFDIRNRVHEIAVSFESWVNTERVNLVTRYTTSWPYWIPMVVAAALIGHWL